MKLQVKKGTQSVMVEIFIQNSSKTDGSGLTGLTNASSGLTAYYHRSHAGTPATQISLVDATVGTFTSGGFKAVDGTALPGVYQLGIPNDALLTGADYVVIMLKGAANMAPVLLEIQLLANVPGEIAASQSVQSVTDPVTVGSNSDKTGYELAANQVVIAGAVSDKTGYALDPGEHLSIADALLTRDWTEVTGAAARSVLNALRFLRNRWWRSGANQISVAKEDDATVAWMMTTTADADASPIIGTDPD